MADQHHQLHNRQAAFYLDQSSLACKAGCGFFGNPEWMGYCSICFKQLNQQLQSQSEPHTAAFISTAGDQIYDLDTRWQKAQSQLQNMSLSHELGYNSPSAVDHSLPSQMTRSTSQMIEKSTSTPNKVSGIPTGTTWQQQQQQQRPFVQAPSTHTVNTPSPGAHSSYLFDKYEEKRRSQNTDKGSNVLKLLRRASTFKEKTHSLSESPTPPASSQVRVSNDTLNDGESAKTASANTSTGSALNPGNLFSNLASPSSIVMSGYDTLTNLHNTIINTAKSSFRASPSSQADAASVHSVSQSEYMHNSSGHKYSPQQPHFLYDVAWVDCLRLTNRFAKDFLTVERQSDKNINELSDMVHDFYQTMNNRFENHYVYKGATSDQLELLNDNMERILNEHIYQIISARIINEDEDHNMAVQKRIRSLNWITVEHLEISIDFQHPVVHDLLDKAICQMVEMNSRTSSIDKLECIVQCSKTIFELLQVNPTRGHSVPVSADQFLPVLVFVVIQANPPMLPADMKYLTRFSNPRRLMSGETGYYFTNLCCALEFIEKASGTSLNISEELFKKYVNGEAVPVTKSQFNTYLCDGLRTMCSNDAALKKLRTRNEARQVEIKNLSEQIDVDLEISRSKLKELHEYSLNLNQKLKPHLPQFFMEMAAQSKDLAVKLLPSFLKQEIETILESETKLVDIDSTKQEEVENDPTELIAVSSDSLDVAKTSLSPVEQLESGLLPIELPEPIIPEPTVTSTRREDGKND